jgi:dolichyl-phosphate beta-glucosyltransferase
MDQPYRLALLIPAYNEERRIGELIEAISLARTIEGIEFALVAVVLNGTIDETGSVARAIAERVGLPLEIWEAPVKGKAAALAWAFPRAGADTTIDGVLFLDADNATDPSQLARFDLSDRDAIWIGSRRGEGAEVIELDGHNPLRSLMSGGMRLATRLFLGLRERDTQCGFKLFPRKHLWLWERLVDRSWIFDVELLARAHAAGIAVREAPVRWVEKDGSKVSPLRDSIGSLRALLRIRRTLADERRANDAA